MRILFVEDNPADARLLLERVADAGPPELELRHVENLAAAREALDRAMFDAALLDLSLPDADGMSGLLALQERDPALPVVVLTGREDPAFAASMVKGGAQDYLLKAEIDASMLERVLRYAVERKRIETELRNTSRRLEATVEQVRRQRRSLALLNEMSATLQGQTSLAEGIERAARILPQLLPGTAGTLESLPGAVAVQWGTPAPDGEYSTRLPLRAQDSEVGALHLSGEADEEMLSAIVRQLGLSLYTIGLHDDLFQQSVRDPLTGLFNRRYLLETVRRELRRALRGGRPLSLLFLDVDRFKQINDRCGHQAGDRVLQGIADLLASNFRTEDVVSRYGGEEFLIALPDAGLEDSLRRAQQLARAVTEIDFGLAAGPEQITVSVGVATFPDHAADLDALIAAADTALYRAKEAGRDRVVAAAR